jgi:hypothetical protein
MFLAMLNILKMKLWYKDIQNVFSYSEYRKNEMFLATLNILKNIYGYEDL